MKENKALIRKVLCGILAVGSVCIGSHVFAEDIEISGKYYSNGTLGIGYLTSPNAKGTENITYSNLGTSGQSNVKISFINPSDKVAKVAGVYLNPGAQSTIVGKTITITAENQYEVNDIDYKARGVDSSFDNSYMKAKLNLGDEKTDTINIIAKAKDDVIGVSALRSDVNIKTKTLNITAIGSGENITGIHVGNNTANSEVPADAATLNVTADTIHITSAKAGLAAFSNGQMNITGDITVDAPTAIDTRGNATIKINEDGNHYTKLNGDIAFDYEKKTSGTPVDSNVIINFTGKDSVWNGNTKVTWDSNEGEHKPTASQLQINHVDISLNDGAQWNPTFNVNEGTVDELGNATSNEGTHYAALNNLTLNDGVINLDSDAYKEDSTLEIQNVNGTGGTINTNSVDNSLLISKSKDTSTQLTVHGTGDIADAIQANKDVANALANVVSTKDTTGETVSAASKITTAEGKVAGAYTGTVENGTVNMNSLQSSENTTNRAISDMASISLMTWRQENNDMNKRLGELRDSHGEHGVWARMARGESKYGVQNVKNQYNYYQIGYDKKLAANPNWTLGFAVTRTEGTSTFTNGNGENKHTGMAIYGSYLADNGSFVDIIAKYARMHNNYDTLTGAGSGDYTTHGYSFSAEYGKRFTKESGFWIEPQAELTYGKVTDANYLTANNVEVHEGNMDSLVGRLGFSLGKNIEKGNVYVRASYLYDFQGETDVHMRDLESGATDTYKQDLGGSWWEVGIGTNLNLSKILHMYFDVEKTYGGHVATPWQWNLGFRWSF